MGWMREAARGATMTGAGSGQGAGMAVAGTVLAVRSRWMGQAAPEADGAARDPGRGGGWDEPHRARRAGGAARLDATSPLALGSHLVGLARDADQAGLTGLAEQLLALACAVLDHPPVAYA